MEKQYQPHVVAIPYPFQGHLMPVVKLCLFLIEEGVKITMLIPEYLHAQLIDSLPDENKVFYPFNFVTFPCESTTTLDHVIDKVAAQFQKLVKKSDSNITCVIVDDVLGHTFEIARSMGVPLRVSYSIASVGFMAFANHIPEMIETGVIDENGNPKTKDKIIWSPNMPSIEVEHLPWLNMLGHMIPKEAFDLVNRGRIFRDSADWVLSNTFHELEKDAIADTPNVLTIGPLLENNRFGNLWLEDSSCMSWLDQQAPNSVIYISFGSMAYLHQNQFEELALALELLEKPFLWVVRQANIVHFSSGGIFPQGFLDKVASFSKIVSWVPQTQVLSHTSVACFVSQCGWNSIIEAVSNGVPLLSWPVLYEQFFPVPYIEDVWRIGLGLNPQKDEIVPRDEIKSKLNQLLGDREIKQQSLKWKEMAMKSLEQGGSTANNLNFFVELLKKNARDPQP